MCLVDNLSFEYGKRYFFEEIPYLIFTLQEIDCAVPLTLVKRVTRFKDVSPQVSGEFLPKTIDFQGEPIPLRVLRQELGIPNKPISGTDRLVILTTAEGITALLVDDVPRVESKPDEGAILFDEFGFHFPAEDCLDRLFHS